MILHPKAVELGRLVLPGLLPSGEIAVCRECGNQIIFDPKLTPEGSVGLCPWHNEGRSEFVVHDFKGWRKSIKVFAMPLDFSTKYAILASRLRKG